MATRRPASVSLTRSRSVTEGGRQFYMCMGASNSHALLYSHGIVSVRTWRALEKANACGADQFARLALCTATSSTQTCSSTWRTYIAYVLLADAPWQAQGLQPGQEGAATDAGAGHTVLPPIDADTMPNAYGEVTGGRCLT